MPKPTSKNRQELRSRFVRNAILTETDFADLIAAGLNQAEDGLLRLPDQSLGLVRQKAELPVLRLFADPAAEGSVWQMQLIGTSNPALGLTGQDGKLALVVDGTTGNVGIGLATPGHKLTVQGVWKAGKDPDSGLANGGTLAIKSNAPQLDFIDSETGHNDWAIHVDSGKMHFVRQPWLITDLVLDGQGKVGVGTDSPQGKLTLSEMRGTLASATTGSLLIDHEDSGGGSSLVFRSKLDRESDYAFLEYRDKNPGLADSQAGLLTIGVQNEANDHLALMPSGNVGIGTTTPEYKLHLVGAAGISGTLELSTASNPIRVSGNATAYTDSAVNRAEIANDTGRFKCLMIIGNRALGGMSDARRQVGLWDDLTVSGAISAANYRFSTQGFEFELKDGILTPLNKKRYVYSYTGVDQLLVVPEGVNWMFVKLWGAGGGAGRSGTWAYGADGGGGGHTRGLFPVTPGDTLIVVIGRGGVTVNGTTQSYGGGGVNGSSTDSKYAGHGGGYCGVFVNNRVSQASALAIAGGGGGGGSSRIWHGNVGGAGGGILGQRGASPYDGRSAAAGMGGTQSSAGSGGSGVLKSAGAVGTSASNGAALQGGAGASPSYGAGGGGGYFGGGGGAYNEPNTMAGGGGGSGFVVSTGLLTGTYAGHFRNVAYSWDPDLLSTAATDGELAGFGGQNTQNNLPAGAQSGGHAYAVVYY